MTAISRGRMEGECHYVISIFSSCMLLQSFDALKWRHLIVKMSNFTGFWSVCSKTHYCSLKIFYFENCRCKIGWEKTSQIIDLHCKWGDDIPYYNLKYWHFKWYCLHGIRKQFINKQRLQTKHIFIVVDNRNRNDQSLQPLAETMTVN